MIFYIFNPHHCKIACCARYESVQEVRILPNNGICTFATQLFSLYFVALLQNRLYSLKTSLQKTTGWVIYFLGVGDIFLWGVGDILAANTFTMKNEIKPASLLHLTKVNIFI